MKKIILSTVAIILTMVLLVSCEFPSIIKPRNDTTESETQAEDKLITSHDGNFTISVPGNWEEVEIGELNELANIELKDDKDQYCFMTVMRERIDFSIDFDGYVNTFNDAVKNSYNTSLDTRTEVTISGYKAYKYEFDFQFSETDLHMTYYVFQTENYYGQVFAWGTPKAAEKYLDATIQAVSTLKETV